MDIMESRWEIDGTQQNNPADVLQTPLIFTLGVAETRKMHERHVLIVKLWLVNNDISAFEAFERQAAKAMAGFGARIERVIRISSADCDDDTPFEIHIVSFPTAAAFQMYLKSSESTKLSGVRDTVIARSEVLAGVDVNGYA